MRFAQIDILPEGMALVDIDKITQMLSEGRARGCSSARSIWF